MIKLTLRYQLSVAFPQGDKAQEWKSLVDKLCKRYGVKPNELIRVALKTLERVDKEDAVTDV